MMIHNHNTNDKNLHTLHSEIILTIWMTIYRLNSTRFSHQMSTISRGRKRRLKSLKFCRGRMK